MDDATLNSSDAAAKDRRILELLLMMMVVHSLLGKESAAAANGDDDARGIAVDQEQQMIEMMRECSTAINETGDQSAVSKEILVVIQRVLNSQLRLRDGGEKGRVEVVSSSASDHQLMDSAAAAKKKGKAAAAKKMKKKRNKRNKAAAKRNKGGAKLISWLGGGIISLIIMMTAFGSVTTLIPLSLIHQSDGSSEGEAPPTLPPSASLHQRDLQSIMSPAPPSIISELPTVLVQSPVFLPAATVSNPPMNSVETMSLSPTSSICTDAPGWYDARGYDCSWYAVVDAPGCPQYGDLYSEEYPGSTVAKDNCCYCQNFGANKSPTISPSSSGTCVDTLGWEDELGDDCESYRNMDDPGCPVFGNYDDGEMGPASDNCCYCKDPTCEDYKWRCQYYTTSNLNYVLTNDPDRVTATSVCNKAASSCCEAEDNVKIVKNHKYSFNETVGLYNECKCDFWLHLCEERRLGEACDYAAEYCCGDYLYYEDKDMFSYLDSPLCYCDFFNYAENEFGHTLKPKALNISKEFSNPCGQGDWGSLVHEGSATVGTLEEQRWKHEKESLEAIYDKTNGRDWRNNSGWMIETDHCHWYGISCDVDGVVTSIDLKDNNLIGQFPVYTRILTSQMGLVGNSRRVMKYGVANLYKLKTLDLSDNKLTGAIEYRPLYNLRVLTHFDVSGNQLSGGVEALAAPSLMHADFSNNSFTFMPRFESHKVSPLQTIRYCDVSNNAIQEDANDLLENMPPNIERFIASNNQIYGTLPASLNNLKRLRQFKMTSNALSGELPWFTESFATLQELDVSKQINGFTGSIPEDIWRSLSLEILNLAGNRLTGTVPSLVGNMVELEVFDLSNNLLDSSLPPELGKLEDSLKRLNLSNNTLSGVIPSQIGQLQGASVFLKDNRFHNTTAPLSLCIMLRVEEFDLADNVTVCPPERNVLSDFYDSAKGPEWTDRTDWKDEYASYCDWKGVTCGDKNHVTKLNLTNNGLSGRLSESIGNLTFMEVLDLSDNDVKGSIPTEIGLLSNLTYLRLSYNAFTGAAPEGLGGMKGLQLLQLQSNRITEMPIIPRLNSIHGQSTFVTDCGVPSTFDEALDCKNCTMCCNANDDCYPQEETKVQKMGLEDYGKFAALLSACFLVLCCLVALLLYLVDKHKSHGVTLSTAMETRIKEDDKYALSKIGKDSVYSYFLTDKVFGWVTALVTLGIQIGILVVFILASEANLQNDNTDIEFTWKCPRDTDVCENKADLTGYGWAIFSVLMIAFLAKDMISGCKLIYHSAKIRHSLSSRIRYFFGGTCLCSITLFALYVSTVYNKAIATSTTEIIVNSVIVLFVMELDEWIFSDLEAINKKWTAHVDESEDTSSDIEARNGTIIAEMKKEIALQKAQIVSQQEELRKLRESVEKIQELQLQTAAAASTNTITTAFYSGSFSDCEVDTNARQTELVDDINMPIEAEQSLLEPQATGAAAATSDFERESDTEEDLQEECVR